MLKIKNTLFVFFSAFTLFTAGCSSAPATNTSVNASESDGSRIMVEKSIANGEFEPFKETTARESVQQVEDILSSADWENAEVTMATEPYVKFYFKEAESTDVNDAVYYLWINPYKDKVELVIEGEAKYVQLSAEDSENLFKAVTGEKLSQVNQ